MALPVALLAGAAIGAGQMAYGASLKKKYQREADANKMPEYQINQEERDMMRQAETMAGQGMSDASREAMRSNTDRAMGTSIDAILKGGGNPNAIASLAGNFQNQINQMAVYEDQARLKNLENLQNQRARMSANRDKAYQINQYQPWANRAQAIDQQLTGAQNMMQGGFNTLSAGVLQGISNMPSKQRTPFVPAAQPQIDPLYASAPPSSYTDYGSRPMPIPMERNVPQYLQYMTQQNYGVNNTPDIFDNRKPYEMRYGPFSNDDLDWEFQ